MVNHTAQSNEIAEIVETYRDSVLRLAYAYLKNRSDAEDIAQEVFIAYIKKSPSFRCKEKQKAWLMKVTANKCKNLLASAWKKRAAFISEDLAYMPNENAFVIEYVFSLEEKYRIPIHLFYYDGYSIKEIADIMKERPATIGTWLARGRQLLKTMIGDDFNE